MITKPLEICLFVFNFAFYFSVTPWINTPESSYDFTILIISFISSFERNKLNPFLSLAAPFPNIILWSLFIAFEVKFLNNPGALSLAKGISIFVSVFFPKLLNQEWKDPPGWIILDICALLTFISVEVLLAMALHILIIRIVVTNNSCCSFSFSKFLLFNLNIVPFFFCCRF